MEKTYVAARDFTAGGKQHKKGEVVSGLAQSEISKRVQAGEITEQPAADTPPAT